MKRYYWFLFFLFFPVFIFPLNSPSVKIDTTPGWTYTITNSNASIAIPYNISVKIGSDTTLEAGDYIGVFYDSTGTGVLACAGYAIWVGGANSVNLAAWGDDQDTKTVKEGFAGSEQYKWKIWKRKTGQFYDVYATVATGFTYYDKDGLSVLSALVTQGTTVLPPWTYTKTANSHIIGVPLNVGPTISGVAIQSGDYIGVFYDSTGSGGYACGGYQMWNGISVIAVIAYGDDDATATKEGFKAKEVFKWKIWSHSDGKQYYAAATYDKTQPNDSLFAINGVSVLTSLKAPITITDTTDTTIVVPKDSVIVLNCDVAFGTGDITKSVNYRMIGLPCDGTLDAKTITLDKTIFYGRAPNIDWTAFYDDGSGGDYIPYTDATKDKFIFKPGKAFWVISKYDMLLSQVNAKAVQADKNGVYKIGLNKEWTMISNPFAQNVDWNALVALNSNITDPIWDFNEQGEYVVPSGFVSYRGYYFYNRKGLDSLKIPIPSKVVNKQKVKNTLNTVLLNDPIKIYLQNGANAISPVYISFVAGADDNLDDFDQFSPPSNFESAKVYFYNEALNSSYKNLYIDARPGIENGQAYDLRVKHNISNTVQLKFEGLDKYTSAGNEIYLINKRSLKLYNLKESSVVTLAASSSQKADEFIIAIGSQEYFKEVQANIVPDAFALNQNYPNPFNPSTTISWQLAADSKVTVKIIDILGREKVVLLNETQTAGAHSVQVSLDKNSLSSGVYFYSITAKTLDGSKDFHSVKKMILLK